MRSGVLYDFFATARAENKAVKLIPVSTGIINEIIIEPGAQVTYPNEHTMQTYNSLINLDFIVAAILVPTKKERE